MNSKIFKKSKLPDNPGVYFFKKGKDTIYIGKATSLKDRVKSYFGKDLIETRGPIILDMVFKADKINWQTTDSVLEALILEANLIKKYQPKYNTKEKSDKSFNYVCITKAHLRHGVDGLPKVLVVRGKDLEKNLKNFTKQRFSQVLGSPGPSPGQTIQKPLFSKVFGPYPNSSQLKEAIKIIRKIFPFLDEKSKNYIEFYQQINLIPDLNDKILYLQNIKNIKLFFEGKKKKILQNLKKEMKEYAKKHEFEKAGEVKRQIFSLKHINDIALLKGESFVNHNFFSLRTAKPNSSLEKIKINKTFRIEAYDIAHMGGKNMVGAMTVVENGEMVKSEYKRFQIRTQKDANDTGALKEVLERRLKHTEWPYPDLIVVDGGVAQIHVTEHILTRFNLVIPVISVVKDERHKPKAIIFSPRSDLKRAQGPTLIKKYKREILLANSEAHRFAINYHKNMRNKNFLK